MKQFFKDIFTSDHSNSQRSLQQPIYSYQIPTNDERNNISSLIITTRRNIQKGPSDAGPQYNIAGV
jgi:hypothetical protein